MNKNQIHINDSVEIISHKTLNGKTGIVESIIYNDVPLFNIKFDDGTKQTIPFYNLKKSNKGIVMPMPEVKKQNPVTIIKDTKNDIVIFFHIACMGNYEEVASEIVSCIIDNELYTRCKKIYYSMIGNPKSEELINYLKNYDKFELCHSSTNIEECEYPTLMKLQKSAQATEREVYLLYIHTKGVSIPDNNNKQLWRKRLLQKTVKEWKECVSLLENGNDISGCGWRDNDNIFQGNIWWAKSSYIKKLPELYSIYTKSVTYKDIDFIKYRSECERWVGSISTKKVGVNGDKNQDYRHENHFDEKLGLYKTENYENKIISSKSHAEEIVNEVDLLVISKCDEILFFNSPKLIEDVLKTEMSVICLNLNSNKNNERLKKQILKCKNVILYRLNEIPQELNQLKGKIKIGYLIDDNLFFDSEISGIKNELKNQIKECINFSDYCLANSEVLANELKSINENSFCIGKIPLYKERYDNYNIPDPISEKHELFSIGITSGMYHEDKIKSYLDFMCEVANECSEKFRVVYFSNSEIKIQHDKIQFERHPRTNPNPFDWYSKLHNLKLDSVFVEYEDNELNNSKSDIKFRESAYIKIPLIAVDPTNKICVDIENGINGFSVQSRDLAKPILCSLISRTVNSNELGLKANESLLSRNPQKLKDSIINVLKTVNKKPSIQVFKPLIRQESIDEVSKTLQSSWIGCGPKTKRFEADFKKYIGCDGECVSVMSATDAIQIALKLIKEGNLPGSEIITTPITFISTNHAILYENLTPIFADVDKHNGNINPNSIRDKILSSVIGIIVVHLSGNSVDMESIEEIANHYNVPIIEDCAHAAGGFYRNGKHKGKRIGSSGNICCFSFQAVKNLPTGDGGMIIVPKFLHKKTLSLRWLGIDKDTYSRTSNTGDYLWQYDVPYLGLKSNQNDILSSIGIQQLKYLDSDNNRRREIANYYRDNLSNVNGITLPDIDTNFSSCHFYPVYCDNRDGLLRFLQENNIMCGVHYKRNDKYENYNLSYLPNAEYIESHSITLPIHLHLTNQDIKYIVEKIKQWSNGTN